MYDGTIIPAPGGWPGPADTVTASGSPSAVAFIPARLGSKRVPGKNIRTLAGHPMIAYTIAPALESGVFSAVIVSTDSELIATWPATTALRCRFCARRHSPATARQTSSGSSTP